MGACSLYAPIRRTVTYDDFLEIANLEGRNTHIPPFLEGKEIWCDRAGLLPDGDVDDCATSSRGFHGCIQCHLDTSAIEHHVDALALAELSASRDYVVLRWVEDVMRTKAVCIFLSLSADLGNDDLIGTLCLKRQHHSDTNGTAS